MSLLHGSVRTSREVTGSSADFIMFCRVEKHGAVLDREHEEPSRRSERFDSFEALMAKMTLVVGTVVPGNRSDGATLTVVKVVFRTHQFGQTFTVK